LNDNSNSHLNDKKGDTAIALFCFSFSFFYCQMTNNKKAKHQNAWLTKIARFKLFANGGDEET
jgi:hypothetical protein